MAFPLFHLILWGSIFSGKIRFGKLGMVRSVVGIPSIFFALSLIYRISCQHVYNTLGNIYNILFLVKLLIFLHFILANIETPHRKAWIWTQYHPCGGLKGITLLPPSHHFHISVFLLTVFFFFYLYLALHVYFLKALVCKYSFPLARFQCF